jgi:ferredoxin-NADP reductase
MSTTEIALLSKEDVANGTMAFHFTRPQGFDFKAGQAADLILPPLGNGPEARHTFSLVSAPHEHELVIATRMRDSAYKRALKSLEIGQRAELEGPFGSLTLGKSSDRPAVLIAGGIGITPYMSMIREAAHGGITRRIVLLYSNRRPEDAAFLAELLQWQANLPSLSVIATMTQMEASSQAWHGERGMLDAARLKQFTGGLANPLYYLAGPPAMVEGLRKSLGEIGIDDDDIRSEDFFGY